CRVHARPGGAERGLPVDAVPVPADHGGRAGRRAAGRHRHRGARSPHPDAEVAMATIGMSAAVDEVPAPDTGRRGSVRGNLVRAVRANRKATAGLVILLFFVILAAIPQWLAPGDPAAEIYPRMAGPSAEHWLGTTAYGQDLLGQVIWGARPPLIIAIVSGLIAAALS